MFAFREHPETAVNTLDLLMDVSPFVTRMLPKLGFPIIVFLATFLRTTHRNHLGHRRPTSTGYAILFVTLALTIASYYVEYRTPTLKESAALQIVDEFDDLLENNGIWWDNDIREYQQAIDSGSSPLTATDVIGTVTLRFYDRCTDISKACQQVLDTAGLLKRSGRDESPHKAENWKNLRPRIGTKGRPVTTEELRKNADDLRKGLRQLHGT